VWRPVEEEWMVKGALIFDAKQASKMRSALTAELAQRSAIGVYPIGGWWKENPQHKRYDRRVRYGLIVSIRATNAAVDIYTPVQAQITVPTEITT
jgi:hypothetical protein